MNHQLAALVQAGQLRRVDRALGEWITRAFPGDGAEVALAAALAARALADGHSALSLDRAQAWLDGLEGVREPAELPTVDAWCGALRRASAVHAGAGETPPGTPLVLDPQRRVYLRRYYEYERQLARALIARATSRDARVHPSLPPRAGKGEERALGHGPGSAAPAPNSESRVPSPEPRTSDQQRALEIALSHRFTLITGAPGTGKTHSVVRMLVALGQQAQARGEHLRIALAAPTGKAAARLKESVQAQMAALRLSAAIAAQVPSDAFTVHRLIGLSPHTAQARHHRDAPLPFDVVIVDEVSMVDLPLMTKLVDAVPESARLIVLGDPGQLSAVEAGDVLGALVAAAQGSPLRDCHATLTRSHRFGPDSPLGALAQAIRMGDTEGALRTCGSGPAVALDQAASTQRIIDTAVRAFQAVVDAASPAAALKAAHGFRVLTTLRRGPWGCTTIDQAIAGSLQRRAGVHSDERWWRGRLVLITANRPELSLFNGDTGVVWPNADGHMKVWFEGDDAAPRALAPAALPSHEGAFALTVHKAQGSEFEVVALATGPPSPVLTRELLHTGVTRARAGVTLYTNPQTLKTGIANPTLRMTGLADRLREAAAGADG